MWKLESKINSNTQKIDKAVDLQDAFERTFEFGEDLIVIEVADKKLILPVIYTFSDLVPDFITILNDLLNTEEGKGVYGFAQNEVFDADWHLAWLNNEITIKINWLMINGKENDSVTELSLDRQEFLRSWQRLFLSLSDFIDFRNLKLEFNEENATVIKLLAS